MPTNNNDKLLTKEQIYEEGKIGGRNKMPPVQNVVLAEFIRVTNEKLKLIIGITWKAARADALEKNGILRMYNRGELFTREDVRREKELVRATGYKEGQRDTANKIFKELDKQVEVGRLKIGKNAIATCGVIKVYRGSAYVDSRKKWLK